MQGWSDGGKSVNVIQNVNKWKVTDAEIALDKAFHNKNDRLPNKLRIEEIFLSLIKRFY